MKEATRQKAALWIQKFIEFYVKHLVLAITIEVIMLGLVVYAIVTLMTSFFAPGL